MDRRADKIVCAAARTAIQAASTDTLMDRRADKIVCAAARTAIQAASTDHARATGLNGVLGTHRVSKDMERDYFMTPEEAREYGIIDRVLSHR